MHELLFNDLMEKPEHASTLCARVAGQLGRQIVTGHYSPGSLLDDENALSARYKVSRTVVRDAIKLLEGKGLLEVRRGIGTRVNKRSDWGLFDDDVIAWQLSGPLHRPTFLQLAELRQTIEPKAARWAAARATAEDVKRIGKACDAMTSAQANNKRFMMSDAGFHRAVLRAAHNDFFLPLKASSFQPCFPVFS